MGILMFLIVVGTSIGVAVDASKLGVRRGLLGSSIADMGPAGWFFCCLLLWIVCFPAYLITRPKYVAAAAGTRTQAWSGVPGAVPPSQFPSSPYGGYAPTHPAGQYSGFVAAPQPATAQPRALPPGPEAAPAAFNAAVAAGGAVVDQLTWLSALRQSGALTEHEFESLKGQLLRGAGR